MTAPELVPDGDTRQLKIHPSRRRADALVFGVLAVTGLSFWFLLGFPYANHNESFAIVAQLKRMGIGDVVLHTIEPVANYRPFGQAVAWLGYRSGDTIWPVEVFNYVVAVAAWSLLFLVHRERKSFAVAALVVGGCFFTGYIYLFHLHGVFYSPLLLLLASSFWLDREFTPRRVIVYTAYALVATFFHPYSLLVFAATLGGLALERRGALPLSPRAIGGVIAAALSLLAVLIACQQNPQVLSHAEMLGGWLASYALVEINAVASAAALCLAVITASTLPIPARGRGLAAVGTGVAGALFLSWALPVLPLWVAICVLKTVLLKKWWIALLLCCTAMFPAPTASGSPTYVVFVLMMCAAVLPYGCEVTERRLGAPARTAAVAVIVVVSSLLVLLRAGLPVPVVSRLAQPLIAEREKTVQMEQIVRWLVTSTYADHDIRFVRSVHRDVRNRQDAAESVDRTFRPPTNEDDLDMYVQASRNSSEPPTPGARSVVVGFGGDVMPPGRLLLVLPAAHAGEARVVLPDTETPSATSTAGRP